MTVAEEKKRLKIREQNRVRDIQYLIKKNFPLDGDLMEWLRSTTGYDKPFPVDPVLMNRAEGQRQLVITIINMVKMSPEEIFKHYNLG